MEYTSSEKQILSLMERTDFRNLSKNDVLSYASKLNELRPEVAQQVIAQFPELAKLIQSTKLNDMTECRNKIVHNSYVDDIERNLMKTYYNVILRQISDFVDK